MHLDARMVSSFTPYHALNYQPARVCRADRNAWQLLCAGRMLRAEVSGRFRHEANAAADYPAVGDWVAIEPRASENAATIHAVLPRLSAFVRQAAGETTEAQVVAANVDSVFLVSGMDGDFNLRRIERYLVTARESGAAPVVVLNKADFALRVDPVAFAVHVAQVEDVARDVPVHAVSALEGDGLAALMPYLAPGQTVALLGSSGVGKSTLVNALVGEKRQDTGPVREDDSRGRHTTTYRELIALASGAWLIDTPGMRELQLWGGEEGVAATFDDVEALTTQCRFGDCAHETEPGCAVQRALATGALPEERYAAWRKLQREALRFAARHDARVAREVKAKWKKIHMEARRRPPKGAR
jgi:ribosome biogenesis GTPase